MFGAIYLSLYTQEDKIFNLVSNISMLVKYRLKMCKNRITSRFFGLSVFNVSSSDIVYGGGTLDSTFHLGYLSCDMIMTKPLDSEPQSPYVHSKRVVLLCSLSSFISTSVRLSLRGYQDTQFYTVCDSISPSAQLSTTPVALYSSLVVSKGITSFIMSHISLLKEIRLKRTQSLAQAIY